MESWRQRGYVPDSDEDDGEDLRLEPQDKRSLSSAGNDASATDVNKESVSSSTFPAPVSDGKTVVPQRNLDRELFSSSPVAGSQLADGRGSDFPLVGEDGLEPNHRENQTESFSNVELERDNLEALPALAATTRNKTTPLQDLEHASQESSTLSPPPSDLSTIASNEDFIHQLAPPPPSSLPEADGKDNLSHNDHASVKIASSTSLPEVQSSDISMQPPPSSSRPAVQNSNPTFVPDENDGIAADPKPRRSLRPRTIVQEMPYRIDYARYAQMCRNRGIPLPSISHYTANIQPAQNQNALHSRELAYREEGSSTEEEEVNNDDLDDGEDDGDNDGEKEEERDTMDILSSSSSQAGESDELSSDPLVGIVNTAHVLHRPTGDYERGNPTKQRRVSSNSRVHSAASHNTGRRHDARSRIGSGTSSMPRSNLLNSTDTRKRSGPSLANRLSRPNRARVSNHPNMHNPRQAPRQPLGLQQNAGSKNRCSNTQNGHRRKKNMKKRRQQVLSYPVKASIINNSFDEEQPFVLPPAFPGLSSHHHNSNHAPKRRRRREKRRFLGSRVQPNTGSSIDQWAPPVTTVPSISLSNIDQLPESPCVDFGVLPLQVGTFFHTSTLLGSDDFARAMRLHSRDLAIPCGEAVIGGTHRWSAYNGDVSSELYVIVQGLKETSQSLLKADVENYDYAAAARTLDRYITIINYISDKLYFQRPEDRDFFVDDSLSFLAMLSIPSPEVKEYSPREKKNKFKITFRLLNLVLAHQIHTIADNEGVDLPKTSSAKTTLLECAKEVLGLILTKGGLSEIEEVIQETRNLECREGGIRDDRPCAQAFVVSQVIIHSDTQLHSRFKTETLKYAAEVLISSTAESTLDVLELEKTWHALFTLLPLCEIDEFGIFHPNLRFTLSLDQWHIVKLLFSPVFDPYISFQQLRGFSESLNKYLRALFHRCFNLVTQWGWRHCKPILDHLFDFFAKRLLHNLPGENCDGSPAFLEQLDHATLDLDVEPEDTCFQIYLKITGVGLRYLSRLFSSDKKKLQNFVWRLLPNHGREYPRDEPLLQPDLDALRNHHDLLCTLYWAVPEGCRPRVEAIQGLIDPASSHEEACKINIDAWRRIVVFVLSTMTEDREDISVLSPFADWHRSFMTEMIRLYQEIDDRNEGQQTGDDNRRQIEVLLTTAVVHMREGLNKTKSMNHAKELLRGFPSESLFNIIDMDRTEHDELMCQALDIADMLALLKEKEEEQKDQQIQNEQHSTNNNDQPGRFQSIVLDDDEDDDVIMHAMVDSPS